MVVQTSVNVPVRGAVVSGRTSVASKHGGRYKGVTWSKWRCAATAPSRSTAPYKETRRPNPERQSLTAADVCTRGMQRSSWKDGHGVVVAPPSRDSCLPEVCNGQAVVMVEGKNDAAVVLQSVNAPVLIVGGTNSAKNPTGFARLQQVYESVPTIVLLADPDPEGNRFRNWARQNLGEAGVLHAFLPLSRAVMSFPSTHKQLGNAGVEHARPTDVAKAISLAHAREPGRSEFSREDIKEWEMVNGWDGAGVQHAALRREIMCNALGVGKMDGGKLVKAMNAYFSHEQVHKAVEFSQQRFRKVLPIHLALNSMRKLHVQDDLIDKWARPSVDAFVYGLQKSVTVAVAEGAIECSGSLQPRKHALQAPTRTDIDHQMMRQALLQARIGFHRGEVPVGAGRWRVGGTLYVTLEPCIMCAGGLLQARVDRLVYGAANNLLGAHGSWVDVLSTDALQRRHEDGDVILAGSHRRLRRGKCTFAEDVFQGAKKRQAGET